jgi:protein-tyrosine phosphatase
MSQIDRLEGALNFRDVGGWRTAHGRQVRRGRVYRSDHLGALSVQDIKSLQRAGRWRVLDFRGVQERLSAPCTMPGADVHSLAIEPTVVQEVARLLEAGQHVSSEKTGELMRDTYRGFVRDNTPRFAQFFRHLLDHDGPMVFHCTAGKDRTGFAAALLLHALDVPHEQIWDDYLITNQRLSRRPPNPSLPPQIAHVLHAVQRDFLQAALDMVEQLHGGLDDYLLHALKVDAAARKELAERLVA